MTEHVRRPIRQSDEFYCPACNKRWHVSEDPPECTPIPPPDTIERTPTSKPKRLTDEQWKELKQLLEDDKEKETYS